MPLSLGEIVKTIDCEGLTHSNLELLFDGVAPLNLAQPCHISFLANEKYFDEALNSKAGLILCSDDDAQKLSLKIKGIALNCKNPYAAFAKVSQFFFKPQHHFSGVSPQAIIDASATVHETATIFPFAFIGPGAQVGKNSVIYPGCFVGATSHIGDDCILYPNVVVREGCHIANRCILNPGAVIGGDGFGFAPTEKENVKIPQIGGVHIGDEVEIGANATIDRGALGNTTVGKQTKIDNLVMLAHNVQIGEFCFVAAQTGIAGSAIVGNRCVLAGQAGVSGHIRIGNNVTVTAQSGVSKNLKDDSGIWQGSPARPMKEYGIHYATLNKIAKLHIQESKRR